MPEAAEQDEAADLDTFRLGDPAEFSGRGLLLTPESLDCHDAVLRRQSREGLEKMKSSILKSRVDTGLSDGGKDLKKVAFTEQPKVAPPPEKESAQTEASDEDTDSESPVELEEWSPLRNKVRRMVLTNAWFERFWLLIIILNCVTLALEDPTDHDCETSMCDFTTKTDICFTVLFTIEFIVKVIGLGFLYPKPRAYLRDEWNVLDFIIVVTGDAALILDIFFDISGPGLTGLRAFRLLRPLKAVQAFPAVRVLVQSILESLPKLLDVCVLYAFFLIVMGIIAVQQWKGVLRWRCFADNSTLAVDDRVCTTHSNVPTVGGHHCEWGMECRQDADNPYNGKLSFDNIGITALTLFTALTLEGWTESMYMTMDGTTYIACIFWVVLIIFGAFFILNLTIVIITEAFELKQYEQKTAAFRAIDTDQGGELDRDEVRRLLRRMTGQRPTEEYLNKVFSEMDDDGGGTVSMDEFIKYTSTHASLAGTVIAGKSSTAGLARDIDRLANQLPFVSRVREMIDRAFEYAKRPVDRSPLQDTVYQVVADSRLKLGKYPTAHKLFNRVIMWSIILNTIVLAAEHYGEPYAFKRTLYWLNVVFTVIFAVECVAKMFGFGPLLYFQDNWNTFDFAIVVLSVFDLLYGGGGGGASAFRAFRVLRVLKLARQVPLLQRWIGILISSMKAAAILTALLGLVIFIVALLGMQLFGGRFCGQDPDWDPGDRFNSTHPNTGRHCQGVPRANYDSVWSAFITTFQILTGEDWNVVMYTGMRTTGNWVCLYFCIYYVLGNYMMLNLFIAVLLSNRDLKDSGSQVTNMTSENASQLDAEDMEEMCEDGGGQLQSPSEAWKALGQPAPADGEWEDPSSPVAPAKQRLAESRMNSTLSYGTDTLMAPDAKRLAKQQHPRGPVAYLEHTFGFLRFYTQRGNSFFVLPEHSGFRLAMAKISSHPLFEFLVLAAIAVSTVTLAVENPRLPVDHPQELFLANVNFVMIWVFLAESTFKSVSYGFIMHPDSYLRREAWNRLDFFIVVVSLASLVVPGGDNVQFIKIMRTLRPLRFINKSKGMKVVVQALVRSIKPLSNVFLISFLVWLIFGILGVQNFGGKFYRCTLVEYGDQGRPEGRALSIQGSNSSIIVTSEDCKDPAKCLGLDGAPCRWTTYSSHFDTIWAAFLTLFEISSLEGWVTVMFLGIDSVDVERAPRKNASPIGALFFLSFVVFGAFFIINMFIGVLIDTYYSEKDKALEEGKRSMFATYDDHQVKWVEEHQIMLLVLGDRKARVGSQQEIRFKQLVFINWKSFDWFITSCIVLNVVTMSMEYYPQTSAWETSLESANMAFFIIFALEAVVKILALGFAVYLQDMWNRFDLSIVLISFAGIMVDMVVSVGPVAGVFRILRLARLLRMVKKAKGIKRILETLYISLPSLINVAGILFLLFFIYAVLGVKLFAKVKRGPAMGAYANFENFGFAMLLLLRMSTGEAWQAIMNDMRTQPPDCNPRLDECSESTLLAPAYFCTFTLSGMYILLNLFIAVILDAFSQAGGSDRGAVQSINKDYMEKVRTQWERRAMMTREETGPGAIAMKELYKFLRVIGPPLGPWGGEDMSNKKLEYWMMPLDLTCDSFGMVNQTELMMKLFSNYVRMGLTDDEEGRQRWEDWLEMRTELNEKHQDAMKQRVTLMPANVPTFSGQLAATRVQALLKGWLVRRALRMRGMMREEGAPVRAQSAFCHYLTDRWEEEQEQLQSAADAAEALKQIQKVDEKEGEAEGPHIAPPVPAASVARACMDKWVAMPEAARQPWRERAEEDESRYQQEWKDWLGMNPQKAPKRRRGMSLTNRRPSVWAAAFLQQQVEADMSDTFNSSHGMGASAAVARAEAEKLASQLRASEERVADLERRLAERGGAPSDTQPDSPRSAENFYVGQQVVHETRGEGAVTKVQPGGVSVSFGSGETRCYPPHGLVDGRIRPASGPLSSHGRAQPVAVRAMQQQRQPAAVADTPLLSAAGTPVAEVVSPLLSPSPLTSPPARPNQYVPPSLYEPSGSCAASPLVSPPLAGRGSPSLPSAARARAWKAYSATSRPSSRAPPDDEQPGDWPPSPRLHTVRFDPSPEGDALGFNVDPDTLLVTRVHPGSRAEAVGLRRSMRVDSVCGVKCTDPTDIQRLLRSGGEMAAWSPDTAAQLISEYDEDGDGGLNCSEFGKLCLQLGLPGPRSEADFAAVCARHGVRAQTGFDSKHLRHMLRRMDPTQRRRVRALLGDAAPPPAAEEDAASLQSDRAPSHAKTPLSHARPPQRPAPTPPVRPQPDTRADERLLREYYRNWGSLTPEQRAEYYAKYAVAFGKR